MNIHPVILCGGSGTRLWPLSRADAPKQFIRIFGDAEPTLFEAALGRLRPEDGFQRPVIVSNEDYRFKVQEGLENAGAVPEVILLEPSPRNTAAAVAAAAAALVSIDPDAIMAVMPSDHVVRNPDMFVDAVRGAARHAADGRLVLLGVTPTEPHTGYGYIRPGMMLGEGPVCAVTEFREKPKREVAEGYLASGDYLWNAGFFIMRAATYLDELGRFEPAIRDGAVAAVREARADLGFYRLDPAAFGSCPSISVDCAVMERTALAAVAPVALKWNDVGSWSSVADVSEVDRDGNVVIGDALLAETTNSIVHAPDRLVATIGLNNVMIVSAGDAVLVADRERGQEVAGLVSTLKRMQRPEAFVHLRQHRPWGFFQRLSIGPRFQVKLLHVKPGGKLSLQMHHHRSEHWVVVRGTARVTVEHTERYLRENESVYISATEWHRLENTGKEPLELVEVQIGSYLGEDDIVRSNDVYNREALEKAAAFTDVAAGVMAAPPPERER